MRFLIAAIAFIHLNKYFEWNKLPGSDLELIADMMFLILLSFSVKDWENATRKKK